MNAKPNAANITTVASVPTIFFGKYLPAVPLTNAPKSGNAMINNINLSIAIFTLLIC